MIAAAEPSAGLPVSAEDHVAIERLVHRYVDAVIHRDGVKWTACWAEDATWDLGRGRLVEGREAISALWYRSMGNMHAVFQAVHSGDVHYTDASGTAAAGRWYINEWYRRADGTPGILLAHYDDEYVRADQGWCFARRLLTAHYHGVPDLSDPFANSREALEARGLTPDV